MDGSHSSSSPPPNSTSNGSSLLPTGTAPAPQNAPPSSHGTTAGPSGSIGGGVVNGNQNGIAPAPTATTTTVNAAQPQQQPPPQAAPNQGASPAGLVGQPQPPPPVFASGGIRHSFQTNPTTPSPAATATTTTTAAAASGNPPGASTASSASPAPAPLVAAPSSQPATTADATTPKAPQTQAQKLQQLYAQSKLHQPQGPVKPRPATASTTTTASTAVPTTAPIAPQHTTPAPSAARSWTVPNPLSAIPAAPSAGAGATANGSSSTSAGGGRAAPNPLASLATNHASSNQSRAALAASQPAAVAAPPQPIAAAAPPHHQPPPQQQAPQQQQPPRTGVPHPLAEQQAQVRALQQQAQQQRAQQQQQQAQQHAEQRAQQQQQQQQQAQQRAQHSQQQQHQTQQQQHLRQQQAQVRALQQQHQQPQPHHHAPPQQPHQPQQQPPPHYSQQQPQQPRPQYVSQQQQPSPAQALQRLQQAHQQHHQQRQPQPQSQSQHPVPQQPQQPPVRKPSKVLLSPEAKKALAKAIWSALKSPDGQPADDLVRAAEATGLPRNAILNAAKVARQREAAKVRAAQQQQQQQQASLHPSQQKPVAPGTQPTYAQPHVASHAPSSSSSNHYPQQQPPQQQQQQQHAYGAAVRPASSVVHSAATAQPQQQQQQRQYQPPQQPPPQQQQSQPQVRQVTSPMISRTPSKTGSSSNQSRPPAPAPAPVVENAWTRVQSGTFIVQKGRFLVLPNTCTAYSSRTSPCKTLTAIKRPSPFSKPTTSTVSAETLRIARILRDRVRQQQPTEKLLDPQKFRRLKVEPKKHARALDRAARKVRQVTAEALHKTQKEWNKALLSHQADFVKFHKSRKSEALKMAKACRDTLDKEEKQKEKEAAAAERARLAALKSNDMSAYSKLLEETKNDRLKFLMDKTEESFTQISTLLHERGGGHGNTAAGSNEKKKEKSSYYESAHFKAEEVRQPSILVGGDLKEYQMGGLQWLVSLYNNKLNGILADEMGLGKTIQAIALLAYLMEFKNNLGPYLVIVPLSTLSNWQNEFVKWCPSARLVCYKGTPGIRKEIYKDQVSKGHFNVLLTTYEYIIKDKKYLRKIDWTYAIVDEGHRMKNAQSKFAVTLGTHYNTEYRVLLTGTPLMNQLSELWSLLNFLLPAVFNSVETFDQWFSKPFSQFGSSSAGPNSDKESEADMLSNEERMLIIHRLHELLRPFMLRRVKSEVLDQLPEKVEKVLRCELSSWQKELYKQISVKAVQSNNLLGDSFVQQQPIPSRGLNNVVMQLRKVCNHPMLFSPEGYQINETVIRSSGKVALLDQMLPKLKAAGHRVLIFTQMTAVMTILEDYFAIRGYLSLRLDGSTPAEEREKRMYKFNAPDSPYFVFLLSTRAGGLGLNLTSADTVIIFDSDWNPMMDLQAQDRAHRIGQRSDVSVFRLITNSPVEEKILSRATEKLNTAALVVEAGKFNKGSVESDNSLERKQLMEILLTDFDTSNAQSAPKGPSEKSGSDNGDDEDDASSASDKEDLNELLSNNETDYALYAKFDEDRIRNGIPLADLYTSPDDVPEWIKYPGGKEKQQKIQDGLLDDLGDNSRKRKNVTYDDGLTEKQFLRMMDKQAIEEEKQKSARKKARKGAKADAAEDDEELVAGNTGSELNDWTFRKLISCTKTVVALKDPATKRRLADLFLEKPAPQQFPDYYELIEKPMAINDILRKCRGKLYTTFSEFRDDWKLMVSNAVKFNGEGSWVVADAVVLEKELDRVLKRNGFTEDKLPSPTKKKPKKLRIKLSLKAVQPAATTEDGGDEAAPGVAEAVAPPKKKRGRRPKKKT